MDGSETIRRDGQRLEEPTPGVAMAAPTMREVSEEATIDDLGLDYDERTGDRIVERVAATELPESLERLVTGDGVLGDRGLFTWKWIYHIFGETLTLPTVPAEYRETAQEVKFLSGTYITLMDDLAEKHGDRETFWEFAKVAYPGSDPEWGRDGVRTDYAEGVRAVWTALRDRLVDAPRYEKFREAFLFDLRAAVHAMDFSRLSGEYTGFGNRTETWKYETAAIGMYATVGADLMYSPTFPADDYAAFRELTAELQRLWRLGNWAITWRREIEEYDFSAAVIVEALQQGIVSERDLDRLERGEVSPERIVARIEAAGIGKRCLADWKRRRDRLRRRKFDLESMDSDTLIDKMEQLMMSHLATEGNR